MAANYSFVVSMFVALFPIFVIVIGGEPCNQTYPDTKIEYITNHLGDANSRSDVYNIYYLGTKQSVSDCLDSCIDFNYLCDKSLTNTYFWDNPTGSALWDFDNSLCSITISSSTEAWVLLTPNITANEYIIDLQVSLSTNSRDAGITFKTKQPFTSYYAYVNAIDDDVSYLYYTDHINGDRWFVKDFSVDIGWGVRYDLQVHVINDKFTLSLDGEEMYSETNSFPPEYGDANYAGIYFFDYNDATSATFHSFKVRYPDSNDNGDAFICAAYVYNNINNDCFGYYGNDYNVIENSISADAVYASGILYESCPPTKSPSLYQTEPPNKSLTKQPSKHPDNIIAYPPTTKDLIPSIHSTYNDLSVTTETKENNVKNTHESRGKWWLWLMMTTLVVVLIISAVYVFYKVQNRRSTLTHMQQSTNIEKEIESNACSDVMTMRSESLQNEPDLTTVTGFGTTANTETARGPTNETEMEGGNLNEMMNHEPKSFGEGASPWEVHNDAMTTTKGEIETDNLDIEMLENENIHDDEFIVYGDDDKPGLPDVNTKY
eukprot:277870_1